MTFNIKSRVRENIGMVQVEGEVDMLTSPNLRDKLLPLFKKKVKGIVIDLSKVSFMDSSGIATLVEGLQWSKKENRPFILAGPGPNVMNALKLTKLSNVFHIRTDMEEGCEQLRQT